MKLYGLYSKKRKCLMAFSGSPLDVEDTSSVTFTLSSYYASDSLWATPDKAIAEKAANNGPTAWYNAEHSTPAWNEAYYGKLEVVDLNEWEEGE